MRARKSSLLKLPYQLGDEIVLRLRDHSCDADLYELILKNLPRLRMWEQWAQGDISLVDVEAATRDGLLRYRDRTLVPCVVRVGESIAGIVSLRIVGAVGEVGYWIGSTYEGRGVMSRSVRAILQHGFDVYDLDRIELRCASHNLRSHALATSVGFVLSDSLPVVVQVGETEHALVLYSISQ